LQAANQTAGNEPGISRLRRCDRALPAGRHRQVVRGDARATSTATQLDGGLPPGRSLQPASRALRTHTALTVIGTPEIVDSRGDPVMAEGLHLGEHVAYVRTNGIRLS
jgi:hypothetical protein